MRKLLMLSVMLYTFVSTAQINTPEIGGGFLISPDNSWTTWNGNGGLYASLDFPQQSGFSLGVEAGFGIDEDNVDQLAFAAPRVKYDFAKRGEVTFRVLGAMGIYEHKTHHEKYIKGGIQLADGDKAFELSYGTLGLQMGWSINIK